MRVSFFISSSLLQAGNAGRRRCDVAGLTFEEFEHLLRTGEDQGRILQVMPWNVYGKMTRLDLRAIYEYLSAIPSLPDNPEPGPWIQP
ncbi:MAG TPA: hypothetical protein VFU13_07375 [Steroidobacteraceae bacterium]|nr:hypothetical protein [Steroidobacteraceae bacterium]